MTHTLAVKRKHIRWGKKPSPINVFGPNCKKWLFLKMCVLINFQKYNMKH